jgi:hypothetical protein
MKKSLTIGITTFGNKISSDVIEFLKGQPINVIISENKEDLSSKQPEYVKELIQSGVNTKYIFCDKPGIGNNRQCILDHVETKYFYTIDNDDNLEGNLEKVVEFLNAEEYDAVYIRCYEDGKYMNIPHNFIYMCTWMQIYRTAWIRELGGYIQSWNFIHEESATNLNWRANLNNKKYRRVIIPKKYLSYKYHPNSACIVSFDIGKVCDFINHIHENSKIKNKKHFIRLFENFVKKYMKVYRVNEKKDVIYINNYVNGKFEDIFLCLNNQKAIVKKG